MKLFYAFTSILIFAIGKSMLIDDDTNSTRQHLDIKIFSTRSSSESTPGFAAGDQNAWAAGVAFGFFIFLGIAFALGYKRLNRTWCTCENGNIVAPTVQLPLENIQQQQLPSTSIPNLNNPEQEQVQPPSPPPDNFV